MPLTDTAVRLAKPGEKPKKMFDGHGLFLLVTKAGGKCWRLKYRHLGVEKLLALGTYPEITLKEARDRRDQARKLLANDVDPGDNKKAAKAATTERTTNSFEVIAREWFAGKTDHMVPGHRKRIIDRLEKDIFPWIGSRPISAITPPELLSVTQRIVNRTAVETARRALGDVSRVFRYAIITGRATSDPARDLRGALPTTKEEHFAAITEPDKLAELLRAIDSYKGGLVVKSALQLAPLLVVRPGELRKMEWDSVNFETKEWRFLVTKTKVLHLVPLSEQAIAILQDLKPLTGSGRYTFPNPRTPDGSRPMSENAVLAALHNLGFGKGEVTGHGFRATFRTIGAEKLKFRIDFMEHQLAHAVRDPMGRAYNRTEFLDERREMMQRWADYLDMLRTGDMGAVVAATGSTTI
ncbi:MAG: integrase arm-type DNA-binding domain-containing protein [Candidatus Riflebacteria bacterium]|nr:integrase arm-type DNA-binding domain-containing protein [Candidatus Riflebacteria bacterium]